MSTIAKTLKLPFLRLNLAKAEEFAHLPALNTSVANTILAIPKGERRVLTSKSFAHVEIGSAWITQTIRNVNARTKVKQLRCLPLAVHHAAQQPWLDAILDGTASPGSLKLWCSQKGRWYACLSVSMDVPDADVTGRWMGIDRGQNIPLAAATPEGPVIFWKAARIRQVRCVYAARRKTLQAAGKQRAVTKLERCERRIVTHINHCFAKDVVAPAQRCHAGIRLEDLSGMCQRTAQRQTRKVDAGQNQDYWPFFQLEHFITYKAQLARVVVEKVPAVSTTKSCHCCGQLNPHKKHVYRCARCGRQAHADANTAQNIREGYGWCCPLALEAPVDGAHGTSPNTVRNGTV